MRDLVNSDWPEILWSVLKFGCFLWFILPGLSALNSWMRAKKNEMEIRVRLTKRALDGTR